jgi:hypothetical protein
MAVKVAQIKSLLFKWYMLPRFCPCLYVRVYFPTTTAAATTTTTTTTTTTVGVAKLRRFGRNKHILEIERHKTTLKFD